MKKHIAVIISVLCGLMLFAQQKMSVFQLGTVTYEVSTADVDSIKFSGTSVNFLKAGSIQKSYTVADVDSLTFDPIGAVTEGSDTIFVTYNGSSVTVNNYKWANVQYTINGANISFVSTQNEKDIVYYLSGTSTDGSFTITPDRAYYLVMDNLSLTSASAAPIVVNEGTEDSYATYVVLKGTSTLTDAASSSYKGCIYAKSKLKFDETSTGTLNVYGNVKHAINSSKKTELYAGTVNIKSAVSDGLNSDGLQMYGGTLNIENVSGDGVEASELIQIEAGTVTINSSVDDTKGLKCDSTILISGGTINITMTGNGSKAIKNAADALTISGGDLTLITNGGYYQNPSDQTDYSFAAGIKSDFGVVMSGGTTKISSTGAGAKGISSDNTVLINNGTLNIDLSGAPYIVSTVSPADTVTVSGVKADGIVTVSGGNSTITLGSNCTDSKGVITDVDFIMTGGSLAITNDGGYYSLGTTTTSSSSSTGGWTGGGGQTSTTTTTDYAEGRCIKADNDISIAAGTLTLTTSNGAKGIKADNNLTVGTLNASNSDLVINLTTSCTQTASSSSSTGGSNMGGMGNESSTTKYAGYPKGFVGNVITVNSGTITFNVKDDAIHGNSSVVINGGDITIAATDDGVHSDGDLTINNGSIVINSGYEGMEGTNIYVTDGYTYITTTDDAWNVANSSGVLKISGGQHWALSSSGDHDCIDSNGSMEFSGGVIITCGYSPIDGDGTQKFTASGTASLLILGPSSANMWSTDVKITYTNGLSNTSCSVSQGTTLCVANSSGNVIAACKVPAAISKVIFCYGSSLSGYAFYTTTSSVNFDLFNGQYTTNATISSSNLTTLSSSGTGGGWGF